MGKGFIAIPSGNVGGRNGGGDDVGDVGASNGGYSSSFELCPLKRCCTPLRLGLTM